MKKLLLCVGAAKTGTTWLYQNLEKNPDLFFAPEKEINYFFSRHGWFDRLTDAHRREKCERFEANAPGTGPRYSFYLDWYRKYASGPVGPDWYRALYEAASDDAWACDFSPSTSLISPEGWDEIAGFADEVRIIYIMRDPLDRLWSHSKFHAQYIGRMDEFTDMDVTSMNAFIDKASLALDGDYGAHLERALKAIPRENALILDYAKIAKEPFKVLRRVESFLGVGKSPSGAKQRERINVSASLPRPEGFGDAYQDRFREQTEMLLDLGVDFAADWLPMTNPRRHKPIRMVMNLLRPR